MHGKTQKKPAMWPSNGFEFHSRPVGLSHGAVGEFFGPLSNTVSITPDVGWSLIFIATGFCLLYFG